MLVTNGMQTGHHTFQDALLLYYSQSIKLIRNGHLQAVREEASSRADSAENATQDIQHKREKQDSLLGRKHSVTAHPSHLAIQVQTLFGHCVVKQYIGVNMVCCSGESKAKGCLDTVTKDGMRFLSSLQQNTSAHVLAYQHSYTWLMVAECHNRTSYR